MSRRVLIISHSYAPEPIGIAPIIAELAEGLAARGFIVDVVAAMPSYPARRVFEGYRRRLFLEEKRNGVHVRRHWIFCRPQPGLFVRLFDEFCTLIGSLILALRGPRPDVVVAVSPALSSGLVAYALRVLRRVPYVFCLQDLLPEAAVAVGFLKNRAVIALSERVARLIYRRAESVVVISRGFVSALAAKGIASDRQRLIYNWVDVDAVGSAPRRNALSTRHGLDERFVVLYAGNVALTQGVDTLVRAAERLRHLPDLRVVIVSDQQAAQPLRELAAQLRCDNVLFLPLLPDRNEVPLVYATADVSVVLQRAFVRNINLPSKLATILASGRPMVAALPEDGVAAGFARESGGALVIAPEDPSALVRAIEWLYRDPELRERLAARGRRFAEERLSRTRALDAYAEVLGEASDRQRSPELRRASRAALPSAPSGTLSPKGAT